MAKVTSFVFLLLLITSVAVADTIVLDPIADSPLFGYSPDSNFGSQDYGYWGYYNGGLRSLIQYDLSSLTGSTVISAQLSWEYYLNYGSGANMWACKVTGGAWDEMSVTWNTQPAYDETADGRLLDIPWNTGSGIVTYDCTAEALPIIQDWIDNPSYNYGMLLRKDPESGNEPRCYPFMREASNQAVQLIIEYTVTALQRSTFGAIKASFQ